MRKTLVDRLKLRISIIKQKLAYDMEPILGYNFLEHKEEKSMKHELRKEVIYDIITIPGLDEYIGNRSER